MKQLAALFATCALAFSAFAADTTRLQVKVTNVDGKPIDRASVIIKIDKGRSPIKFGKKTITHWETRTNQDGLVKLPEMPKAPILLQVIAKGYQTYGQRFTVDQDDQTIEVKLNPPQPQYSAHQ